jgi:hypothetical protein
MLEINDKTIYSIDAIKDQARKLVKQRLLSRKQRIYALCNFIPAGQWRSIELELELNEYLLRDNIIDLIQPEKWDHNYY